MSVSGTSTVVFTSSTTSFGSCKASTPATCGAKSKSSANSTYLIARPTSTPASSSRSIASTSATSTSTAIAGLTGADVQHHGMTTGAKEGLGIGLGIGLLALIALIAALLLLFRRRRASAKNRTAAMDAEGTSTGNTSGVDGEKGSVRSNVQEVHP